MSPISVIADSDHVTVLQIDRTYLEVVFVRHPDIASRFYQYIGTTVFTNPISLHHVSLHLIDSVASVLARELSAVLSVQEEQDGALD